MEIIVSVLVKLFVVLFDATLLWLLWNYNGVCEVFMLNHMTYIQSLCVIAIINIVASNFANQFKDKRADSKINV